MSVTCHHDGHTFQIVDPDTYPYGVNTFTDPEPILKLWKFSPGDVAVDIGASFGCFTCFALVLGADVISFEPSEDGHRVLTENIRMNGWQERCAIHKVALYDGTSLPDNWVAEVFGIHYPAKDVHFKSLDEYNIPRINKMKIDVEGSELSVLLGGLETIRRCKPIILIEDHDGVNHDSLIGTYPESIGSSGKIQSLLSGLGYSIVSEPYERGRKYLIATPLPGSTFISHVP
jgi:FkbM family methyltransferase